jgi:hypothetical protein
MADSSDGRDFLGPMQPLFPDLSPEQRAQFEALEAQAMQARERMLSFIDRVVRQQREAGIPPAEIRSQILASLGEESTFLGGYFHERLVADIQNTIEDALEGRPPRFVDGADDEATPR